MTTSTEERVRKPRKPPKIRSDTSAKVIKTVSVIVIVAFSLACLLPFLLLLSASFTSQDYITVHGYSLIPHDLTLEAYKLVFVVPSVIVGDYILTILLTLIGTAVGLFLMAMAGYALQRPDFTYRNVISFIVYFTTLFSGGLIPYYLMMVNTFHLKNSYLSVLLPSLMTPWLLILMKSFLKTIPHELTEAAKIDGAGDFTIFLRVIVPLATPALATVGLFTALGYWNGWYNALLFLDPSYVTYQPLQFFLYRTVNSTVFLTSSMAAANISYQTLPTETLKMAVAVIATGPIVIAYPFVQKYFVQGLTVGAVKG